MGVDTNAHFDLYGDTQNRRGDMVEEKLGETGLRVENRGKLPTF